MRSKKKVNNRTTRHPRSIDNIQT